MSAKKMGAPLQPQQDTRCRYPSDTTIVPRLRWMRKPSLGRRFYRLTVGCAGAAGIIGGYILLCILSTSWIGTLVGMIGLMAIYMKAK